MIQSNEKEIQTLLDKNSELQEQHKLVTQRMRFTNRTVIAHRAAVDMGDDSQMQALLQWHAVTNARATSSTAPPDGWDVIAGNRKTLAVENPPGCPAPLIEDQRSFLRFRGLPLHQQLLVQSWCLQAATWSRQQLPHLREAFCHAFTLLYQGPNSPAQIGHIDLLPGAYQGSLACTVGTSTELFVPDVSLTPDEVAGMMDTTVQQLMRDHSEILGMRDLLLEPSFQPMFEQQQPGDACLMEGGIVHRGPALPDVVPRTGPGRLQLFWVVTPTYHYEQYDSDSQTWLGDIELQMAVEAASKPTTDALVQRAAERINTHWDHYPPSKKPYGKLEPMYEGSTPALKKRAKVIAGLVKKQVAKLQRSA